MPKNLGSALLVVPSDDACGPAMRQLTDKQRLFVVALATAADPSNETAIARAVGYSRPDNDGSRLMRNPKILAAIREEADKRLKAGAFIAVRALTEIAMDSTNKQRFQAAQALLDRAGLQVIAKQEIAVTHEDNRTTQELIEYIKAIERKHQLDPGTLLGKNVIEGDFTVVAAPDPFVLEPDEFADETEHLEGES